MVRKLQRGGLVMSGVANCGSRHGKQWRIARIAALSGRIGSDVTGLGDDEVEDRRSF